MFRATGGAHRAPVSSRGRQQATSACFMLTRAILMPAHTVGLPVWLRDLPGVVFRDNNEVWKREMATWVRRVAKEIEPFLARHGGPVMMVQIENEYNFGWFGAWEPAEYIEWTGMLAKNLSLDVPTMMCNGMSASGTLNAYNGNDGASFAASHRVEYTGQPLLWSENEMGAGGWAGNLIPGRTAPDVSQQHRAVGGARRSASQLLHVVRWKPCGTVGRDGYFERLRRHGADPL